MGGVHCGQTGGRMQRERVYGGACRGKHSVADRWCNGDNRRLTQRFGPEGAGGFCVFYEHGADPVWVIHGGQQLVIQQIVV